MNKKYIKTGGSNNQRMFLTEEGYQFLKEELEKGQSYAKLSKVLDISPYIISRLCKENNIHKDNRRKYTLNEDYFSKIDTPEKAYWLGFLAADGYIVQKNGLIRLTLQVSDKEHINKFLQSIGSNKQVQQTVARLNGKEYPQATVSVHSVKMTKDLLFLGLYPNKSLTFEPPSSEQIPRCFIKYWILGYMDGDGCISIYESRGRKDYRVSFTGTKETILFIQDFAGTNLSIRKEHRCTNNTYSIGFGSGTGKTLLDYLYEENIISVCLERKYKKYLEICNIEKQRKQKYV